MTSRTAPGPLAGFRVIDFGQYLAGPAAAMMLADSGAEVIRVDPPGGPFWKTPANAVLNRGKKSIVLDLKNEVDSADARRLVASADVVIENFRPGVMTRLGVGYEEMSRMNPGLVYLSIPGFSSKEEGRAELQAWEGIIAASVGQFTDMGLNRVLMGISPSYSPLPLASAYASVFGALAVTLALQARQSDGVGDRIEVPLAAALMEGLAYNSMFVERFPERYKSLREREIERRRAAKLPMNLSYEDLQDYLDPFYRTYVCGDGRPFYVVCGSHASHPIKALEVLGLWEEMRAAGVPLEDPYRTSTRWPKGVDCTLKAYPLSHEWARRISTRMKDVFLQRSSNEWEELFGRAGVPGSALRTTMEWLNSEHALSSALVVEVADPEYGRMRQAGNVAWLASDAEAAVRKTAAPKLNEHRDEVLGSLVESVAAEAPIRANHEAAGLRLWLQGIKILDLTNVIAGPTIAATLARFGAEVIKVDPPTPTFDPWNTIVFGMQANRGKSSVLADLKTPEGQRILEALLRQVDIVTINAADRQLAPLGLDADRLKTINPDLILCHLDALGGPRLGPRSNHPGYDDLVQASTGIMARFGGSLETPEEHAHLGTIDVLGGLCGALAIGLALVKRSRGGGGDVARSSLAAAGQLIQIPFMFDYDNRAPFDEPSGRHVKGEHALYRCYTASDGWFFLAARATKRAAFASLSEFADIEAVPDDDLQEYLAARFQQNTLSYWVAKLRGIDVGIHAMETMAAVREANLAADGSQNVDLSGPTMLFIRHQPHPSGRFVDLVAPNAIRPANAAITIPNPAPKYGSQTRSIVSGIGYEARGVNSLVNRGILSESWSEDYLPE